MLSLNQHCNTAWPPNAAGFGLKQTVVNGLPVSVAGMGILFQPGAWQLSQYQGVSDPDLDPYDQPALNRVLTHTDDPSCHGNTGAQSHVSLKELQ